MKTPCEKLDYRVDYRVGDRFVIRSKNNFTFVSGSIIELIEDLINVRKVDYTTSCLQAENEDLKEEIKRLKLENRELTERRKETISMCDQLMTENSNLLDKQEGTVTVVVPEEPTEEMGKAGATECVRYFKKACPNYVAIAIFNAMIAKAKEE